MNDFLSQEEINALLQGTLEEKETGLAPEKAGATASEEHLDLVEIDALGEIGNISMGSAATALSQLLNQRVNITTPKVEIMSPMDLLATFNAPFMLIEVGFVDGLEGSNLLVLKVTDAMIIADLMMGGDGSNVVAEVTELHASAVSEAMNQMMGSAATSMSSLFNTKVVISTPTIQSVNTPGEADFPWLLDDPVVVVSFRMEVSNLIDSTLIQVMPAHIAKTETAMLMGTALPAAPVDKKQGASVAPAVEIGQSAVSRPDASTVQSPKNNGSVEPSLEYISTLEGTQPRNLDLILDVPLRVSVVLGKTKRPIKEVLDFNLGSIVELDKLAKEPVDILVNGKIIAKGEVVVVNENFGIKITSIESPVARITNLGK
ncbi:MAG: flagellar motor switch phosphatase FliY [Bacillota bacterium]